MNQILTIFFLSLATGVFGQSAVKKDHYDKVPELTLIDNLSAFRLAGTFINSNGFTGYRFILDSNQNFQKMGFDCLSRDKVDSGTWSIENGNTLILMSEKTEKYDVVQLDKYYFIVPQSKRSKFVEHYLETKSKFRKAKPIRVNEHVYTVGFMIGLLLIEKYFAKKLDDVTGT
jgi:hypothetical protein